MEEERDLVFSFCLVVFLQLLSFWELWILDEYCGGKIQQESFFKKEGAFNIVGLKHVEVFWCLGDMLWTCFPEMVALRMRNCNRSRSSCSRRRSSVSCWSHSTILVREQ